MLPAAAAAPYNAWLKPWARPQSALMELAWLMNYPNNNNSNLSTCAVSLDVSDGILYVKLLVCLANEAH